MKTCTRPGCAAPHRARGLCSTHYNQRDPNRHRAVSMPCIMCDTMVARPRSSDRRPVCSVTCRTRLQHGDIPIQPYDWAKDAAERARAAGAIVVELFDRIDVFKRDGWTCGICLLPVDPDADPLHPDSPTVDHVVPLSRGGEHTMANAQCAHLRCNSVKSDGEQPHAA